MGGVYEDMWMYRPPDLQEEMQRKVKQIVAGETTFPPD